MPDTGNDTDVDEADGDDEVESILFDWTSLQPGQSGTYTTSSDCELVGGSAKLAYRSDPAWGQLDSTHRLVTEVTGSGTEVVTPLSLDLSGAPADFFQLAQTDGSDVLPVDGARNEVLQSWLDQFDGSAGTGMLWVKLDPLPADLAEVLFYIGGGTVPRVDEEIELFSYSMPIPTSVVIMPPELSATLSLASMVDGNQIVLDSVEEVVDARQLLNLSSSDFAVASVVQASAPFAAAVTQKTVATAPLALASNELVAPVPRGSGSDHVVHVYAPVADARVEFLVGGDVVQTKNVRLSKVQTVRLDAGLRNTIGVRSDVPVVSAHEEDDHGFDPMPILAPAHQMVGGVVGDVRVGATEDGTLLTVTYSGGGTEEVSLDRGLTSSLSEHGDQGSGDAVWVSANHPVTGMSVADGDGGSACSFASIDVLGMVHVVPLPTQYLFVAAPDASTGCTLFDPLGIAVDEQDGGGGEPPVPGRMYFGSEENGEHIAAGSMLVCDQPVWVVMEDATENRELNLWSERLHRPLLYPEPSFSVVRFESRFSQDAQWAQTPTYTPTTSILAWTGFQLGVETDIPADTSLALLLSSDGGTTWLRFNGSAWASDSTDIGNSPEEVASGIASFPTDGTLTLRALLESPEGVETPVVGPVIISFDSQ